VWKSEKELRSRNFEIRDWQTQKRTVIGYLLFVIRSCNAKGRQPLDLFDKSRIPRHSVPGIRHQCPVSDISIRHPVSSIQDRASSIQNRVSSIQYPASSTCLQPSTIYLIPYTLYPSLCAEYRMPNAEYRSLHRSTFPRHLKPYHTP